MKKILYFLSFTLISCLSFTGCSSSKETTKPTTEQKAQNASGDAPVSTENNTNQTQNGTLPAKDDAHQAQDNTLLTKEPPTATKAPQITKITISAAGDCTFGSDQSSPLSVNFYSVYNREKNNAYFFQKVKKIFAKDDLTLVNLEGTLTTRGIRMDKAYAFRGDPSYVNILKEGSVEAVSFANNHCKDYGEISYTDTTNILNSTKIKYSSFEKVSIFKIKGKKIGMIAVNGLSGTDYAKNLIKSGIKKLKKKKADLMIVSIHAGIEHTSTINDVQTQLAHYAVQQGAHLVLGHHPHTLQGIEKYKGAYIVYSLANFCFGGNTNPSDKDTMIFQQTFTFKENKLKKDNNVRIIPCRVSSTTAINNYQPVPLKGKSKQKIIQNMNNFSKPFGIHFQKNGKVQN